MNTDKTLTSDSVELSVLLEGGHVAPVRFRLDSGATVMPYSIAPWAPEDFPDLPPLLRHLRGDFFCFPFGVSEGVDLPHGESANLHWQVEQEAADRLVLALQTTQPAGRIRKTIRLRPGHRVLYQEHRIEGVQGRFNYGHHPILEIPAGVVCPVRASPFHFGQVYPGQFAEDPAMECSALKPGARFDRLDTVELESGGTTSLAEYPARDGYEDLVMLSTDPAVRLGWTAVSFPGYVWLSLRDTRQFPSTVFWLSNGGRAQAPWNGRHRRRIGIEDVCSHFHDGAHRSSQSPLAGEGIATAHQFKPEVPFTLRHAQMVVPVEGQPAVAGVCEIPAEDRIEIRFEDAQTVTAESDWRWLSG